jgi:hypothetical protein
MTGGRIRAWVLPRRPHRSTGKLLAATKQAIRYFPGQYGREVLTDAADALECCYLLR